MKFDDLLTRAILKYGTTNKYKLSTLLNVPVNKLKLTNKKSKSKMRDLEIIKNINLFKGQYESVGAKVGLDGGGVYKRINELRKNIPSEDENKNEEMNENDALLAECRLDNTKSRKKLRSMFLRKEIQKNVEVIKKGRKGIDDILDGMPKPVNG